MQRYKILISLLLIGYGAYILYHRFSDDSLPIAAFVTQSHKERITTSSDRPGSYHYTFEYQYSYLEKTYVSDRYSYGGRDKAEGVCKYKSGDSLTAYVNPDNPSYSVITRDVSGFVYGLTVVGVLMLVQTILSYMLDRDRTEAPKRLQKVHNALSAMIGITAFFGGIGYFMYILIVSATTKCVH